MHRPTSFAVIPFVLTALLAAGCGEDDPPTGPSAPPPVALTETFSGTLTVNGAVTNPFSVTTVGELSARLASLSVEGAVVGLSLGTWNGQVCQLILTNDNATMNTTVPGSASTIGAFCVRIYDVGKLTGPVDFEITVTHF
jgi:hypothetical protein